jgi:hypothetical protein
LIANTPMDTDKIKIYGAKVKVDSMSKTAEIEEAEKGKMRKKCEKILAHKDKVCLARARHPPTNTGALCFPRSLVSRACFPRFLTLVCRIAAPPFVSCDFVSRDFVSRDFVSRDLVSRGGFVDQQRVSLRPALCPLRGACSTTRASERGHSTPATQRPGQHAGR